MPTKATPTHEETARESLVQEQPRQDGDQDRPDADEHRRRSCVDAPLARVERDVVRAEPEQPANEEWDADLAQRVAAREALAACQADDREGDDGDGEPAERECARRIAASGGADTDEGRAPEEDGDACCAERRVVASPGGKVGGGFH